DFTEGHIIISIGPSPLINGCFTSSYKANMINSNEKAKVFPDSVNAIPIMSLGIAIFTTNGSVVKDAIRNYRKFNYIFHIRNLFTHFSYAELAESKLADEAAIALFNFCPIYGPPAILHTDNGSEFIGTIFKETMNILNARTSLKKAIIFFKRNWNVGWRRHLGAINNQYCSAHKTMSYNLVFGHIETKLADILKNNNYDQEEPSNTLAILETNNDN
ncbi:18009_t:CDS:2, partial [Gigaspora rosea]